MNAGAQIVQADERAGRQRRLAHLRRRLAVGRVLRQVLVSDGPETVRAGGHVTTRLRSHWCRRLHAVRRRAAVEIVEVTDGGLKARLLCCGVVRALRWETIGDDDLRRFFHGEGAPEPRWGRAVS